MIDMEKSHSAAYAAAGVDITAGYKGVKLMSADVKRTHIPGVVSDIGGFGGLFAPDLTGMTEPVLVSGTDGVGTKLRLAELLNKHDTIGIDCVAMCVNDVICCGAKPLFFLDYIAIGKNVPEKVAAIVSGVAEGCVQAGCALIGGETAEHPGMMAADDYDLAGFTVGCPPPASTPTATLWSARYSTWRTPIWAGMMTSWVKLWARPCSVLPSSMSSPSSAASRPQT